MLDVQRGDKEYPKPLPIVLQSDHHDQIFPYYPGKNMPNGMILPTFDVDVYPCSSSLSWSLLPLGLSFLRFGKSDKTFLILLVFAHLHKNAHQIIRLPGISNIRRNPNFLQISTFFTSFIDGILPSDLVAGAPQRLGKDALLIFGGIPIRQV